MMDDLLNFVSKKTVEGPVILIAEKDTNEIAVRLEQI
jgi:hypothetical protein